MFSFKKTLWCGSVYEEPYGNQGCGNEVRMIQIRWQRGCLGKEKRLCQPEETEGQIEEPAAYGTDIYFFGAYRKVADAFAGLSVHGEGECLFFIM